MSYTRTDCRLHVGFMSALPNGVLNAKRQNKKTKQNKKTIAVAGDERDNRDI